MENITKISIKRLSKCAGVKTLSDDCYDLIREIIENKLKELVDHSYNIMCEGNSKTLSSSDIHHSLELRGEYILKSENLN